MEYIKINSAKAWLLAARPKTLTGALLPVMVGSALAFMHDAFNWIPAVICMLFAGLMQIAANFINDLFDYLKGSDREDRLGPERACSQGWISPDAMKKGILITIIIAGIAGCTLIIFGGWKLILIGVLCVLFAFFYTTGPYPLSYHGWGDALVIFFFGFVAVGGTYYVQALTISKDVIVASLICGLIIDTLLVINNYRDRDADRISGKRTIIVRFGEKFGSYFYLLLGITASLLCLWFAGEGRMLVALLPQLYLIPHIITWRKMIKIYKGKALNNILGETSRNMLLMGLLLSLSMVLS